MPAIACRLGKLQNKPRIVQAHAQTACAQLDHPRIKRLHSKAHLSIHSRQPARINRRLAPASTALAAAAAPFGRERRKIKRPRRQLRSDLRLRAAKPNVRIPRQRVLIKLQGHAAQVHNLSARKRDLPCHIDRLAHAAWQLCRAEPKALHKRRGA